MIKPAATILLTLSFCLTAGCNRSDGEASSRNSAAGNSSANAAAPAEANSANAAAPAAAGGQGGVKLALDSEGLRAVEGPNGRTSLLAFGDPVDQAIAGLNIIFGSAPSDDGTNEECGGGAARIVQWNNGFSILAQDGKLAGWEAQQAGPTTTNGIGVGSSRAQLDGAFQPTVEQSTLGTEFRIGEDEGAIGGLLSADGPQGRVTSLWAGFTCHFR